MHNAQLRMPNYLMRLQRPNPLSDILTRPLALPSLEPGTSWFPQIYFARNYGPDGDPKYTVSIFLLKAEKSDCVASL